MLAFLITLNIDQAKTTEFENEFRIMERYVEAHEPGTLVYKLGRKDTGTGVYRLIEIYQDEEALSVHGASEAFALFRPKLHASAISPSEVEKVIFLE